MSLFPPLWLLSVLCERLQICRSRSFVRLRQSITFSVLFSSARGEGDKKKGKAVFICVTLFIGGDIRLRGRGITQDLCTRERPAGARERDGEKNNHCQ